MVIHNQNDVIEPTEPVELTEGRHMVDVLLPKVGYFLVFSVEWDYATKNSGIIYTNRKIKLLRRLTPLRLGVRHMMYRSTNLQSLKIGLKILPVHDVPSRLALG